MSNRWGFLLLAGALAITGCQNCGGPDEEAVAEAARQAEQEAAARRDAAEQEAAAAAERAAAAEAEARQAAAAQAAAEAARSHTVVPGDCLWYIAEDRWGDGARWPAIHQANADVIRDPDLIYPGQVLSIPSG